MSDRNQEKVPFFCPYCKSPMSSSGEVESFKRMGGCTICETYFVYLEPEKWKKGWRPTVGEARAYLLKYSVQLLEIKD
jgi:hypothetical protein